MNDGTWYVIRNTRGVTGFVGPGSKSVPLTDSEMKALGNAAEKTETVLSVDFAEGDSVVVTRLSYGARRRSYRLVQLQLLRKL